MGTSIFMHAVSLFGSPRARRHGAEGCRCVDHAVDHRRKHECPHNDDRGKCVGYDLENARRQGSPSGPKDLTRA